MKTLIVEDDFTSRMLLQRMMNEYGETDIAVDGRDAVVAFRIAAKDGSPYDLICLDIMMPEMDGHEVLREIRKIEKESDIKLGKGVKIIMTTALSDSKNVLQSFREFCDAYVVKPIDKSDLEKQLQLVGLLE